jgi:hypothetical protein
MVPHRVIRPRPKGRQQRAAAAEMRASSPVVVTVAHMFSHSSFLSGAARAAGRRRARRGATLLVTVLLTTAAASIVLVIVAGVLANTRTEVSRVSADSATQSASAAQAALEAALAADPQVFLHKVLAAEPDRVCLAEAGAPTYGDDTKPAADKGDVTWPADCGGVWEYRPATADADTILKLTPPSPANPLLTAEIVGRTGGASAGLFATYRLDGAGRYTLWSQSDLALDPTVAGGGTTALTGDIYSAGTVFLPTSSRVQLSGAQVLTEDDDLGGVPAADGTRFYAAKPQVGDVPVHDVRTVVPAPLTLTPVIAQVGAVHDAACAPAAVNLANGYSSELCLRSSASYVTAVGSSVASPAGVKAWLLLTGRAGAGTVDVLYSTSATVPAGECDVRCTPAALADDERTSGTHPGVPGYWTTLGTFRLPADGVVTTDATTHLGLCGNGFATYNGTCDTVSGAAPGMAVDKSFTVLAGTVAAPADVYLSGPIHAVGSARLGVVATGSIVVPYWARPGGTTLDVDAALVALGTGVDVHDSSFRTWPKAASVPGGASDPSYAAAFHLTGTLAGPHLDLNLGAFRAVTLSRDDQLLHTPPPYLPGFSGTWERVDSRPLTTDELAAFLS